jgi:Tfp pilus assembly protein PilN
MIEVNLLPPMYRPSPGASLPRIALMIVGGVGALVMFLAVLLQWNKMNKKDVDIARAKSEIEVLKKVEVKLNKFLKDIEDMRMKHKNTLEVLKSRRLWTPLLDAMAQDNVIPRGVWMRSFKFSAVKGSAVGGIDLECFARSLKPNAPEPDKRRDMGEAMYAFINNLGKKPSKEASDDEVEGTQPKKYVIGTQFGKPRILEQGYKKLAKLGKVLSTEVLEFKAHVPFKVPEVSGADKKKRK